MTNEQHKETTPIKVAFFEDEYMLFSVYKMILPFPEFDLYQFTSDWEEFYKIIELFNPHIVVIDLKVNDRFIDSDSKEVKINGSTGLKVIERVKRSFPKVKILVVTRHNAEDFLAACFKAGARGFINKLDKNLDNPNPDYSLFAKAITGLYNDGKFILPMHQHLLEQELQPESFGISRRELEVLALVKEGLNNREIAEKLTVVPRTVHSHLKSIYQKLNIHSRTGAVNIATKNKLI